MAFPRSQAILLVLILLPQLPAGKALSVLPVLFSMLVSQEET